MREQVAPQVAPVVEGRACGLPDLGAAPRAASGVEVGEPTVERDGAKPRNWAEAQLNHRLGWGRRRSGELASVPDQVAPDAEAQQGNQQRARADALLDAWAEPWHKCGVVEHQPLSDRDAIGGALWGTALGDALGLPYEGLSARRGARVFPDPSRFHFALGRGMGSDDAEHACMALQALCAAGTDPDGCASDFARRLRWWLVGIPAGIGYATLRAGLRSWLGWSHRTSGVQSAGNGAAMRAPVLGAAITDPGVLVPLVRALTLVTHRDPRAFDGALAAALAAWAARRGEPDALLSALDAHTTDPGARTSLAAIERAMASAVAGEPTADFARSIGCARGVSGYVLHTVPVAIHAWRRAPRDWNAVVTECIRCGGDCDTVAAIAGGIAGAGLGPAGLPGTLLARYADWPRSLAWMEALARVAAGVVGTGVPTAPPHVSLLAVWPRNVWFLAIVLTHAARRALPPY